MNKFYILYRDGSTIEGKLLNCTEEQFKLRFILPLQHDIYSFMFWKSLEEQDIENLIEQS